MRDLLYRLRVLGMVLLVLTSGIGYGSTQTVVAAEAGDCSNLDTFVMFATLGLVNAEDCSRQAYVEQAVEDMKESDANQTKVDVYSAASGLESGQAAYGAPFDNYLNDTESVAWMKAQVAIAEAYQDGKTKSQARVAAREAVSNYYAVKQKNLVEQWNTSLSEIDYLSQTATMEDGMTGLADGEPEDGFVKMPDTGSDGGTAAYEGMDVLGMNMVNGNSTDVKTMRFSHSNTNDWHLTPTSGRWVESYPDYEGHFVVEAPDTNYDPLPFFHFKKYKDRWHTIETKNDNLQAETDTFVNSTWTDYENGVINASDVISANTAMFEYGVRNGNETEDLHSSVAALALMGFDTPQLNGSGVMNITYNGYNYEGMVMAHNAPNGSWEAGKTYNTSDIDGVVFLATTDGRKIDIGNGETFTIDKLTARDGSDVQSVNTTKYVYKTANTSELLELQEDLIELRQQIEYYEDTIDGSGSGTSDSGFSWSDLSFFGIPGAVIAMAAGVAVLLLGKQN